MNETLNAELTRCNAKDTLLYVAFGETAPKRATMAQARGIILTAVAADLFGEVAHRARGCGFHVSARGLAD